MGRKGATGGAMTFERRPGAKVRRPPATKAGPVTIKKVDPQTGEEVVVGTQRAYTPKECNAITYKNSRLRGTSDHRELFPQR